MKNQEAKNKNQETLKLLRKEEKKLSEIEKSVCELRNTLWEESNRLNKQIRKLAISRDYHYVVRIGDIAYDFHYSDKKFTHALRQNERNEFDLYDMADQIIPPSKKKSHLGFKVGQQVRIKQNGQVPFRYKNSQFYFPVGVDIVEPGGSHYVLGESLPEEVKNPFATTKIECFYEDGKALVEYYTTRNCFRYFEIVDLSNYEGCSHLEWDSNKGMDKPFAKYLETNGLTGKIEFEDQFGFSVDETIYVKSHEIILENPTIKHREFERVLGKDLHFMWSFTFRMFDGTRISPNCEWKVFGFVEDKILVECKNREFRHFELFSPDEIGLMIDLDYRLKKEKYFDRLEYKKRNASGEPILTGISKKK
jgi:hypothetical protein